MKRLSDLLRDWVHPVACPDVSVHGLSLDTRNLTAGEAFVALPGAGAHGLDFIEQARAAGAAAILCEQSEVRAGDLVAVPDLAARLPELARRMWDDPARHLVLHGITGTNGKSSCAWLLAEALDGAMIGTLGAGRPGQLKVTDHTTPDLLSVYRTLATLRDNGDHQVAMEVSSHALIQNRIAGLSFQTVAFTNLSHDHLDYHATMEAYGQAKSRLLTDWPSEIQLVNTDDDFGAHLARRLAATPGLRRYGVATGVDVRATDVHGSMDGIRFTLSTTSGSAPVHTSLLGEFNVHNLLVVAGVLLHQGLNLRDVATRLGRLRAVPGRMSRLRGGPGLPDVVVDYAHSPDALQRALCALTPLVEGQLVCVFGCGGNRDRFKRAVMGEIAERLADRIVLTDDNPRDEDGAAIIQDIQAGLTRPEQVQIIRDRREAIATAVRQAQPGDVVLVAGKGHETEQIVAGVRLPFSDFSVARDALGLAA